MSSITHIIRSDIRALAAYAVPDATGLIKLDAMENPYALPDPLRNELAQRLACAALNRYPIPSYLALKQKICEKLGVPAGFDVVLGNGSDELISMLSVACAKPGAKVLAPVPSFVMYALSAKFAGLEFIPTPLRADFSLDKAAMLAAIAQHKPAITYLAYPNNPTGTLFHTNDMVDIIEAVAESGLVIVDEAYQPFAQVSFMSKLPLFNNLVVMRTLSKLGLAGIRLGYLSAHPALLAELDKVRPPYNINVLTQTAAEFMLDHLDVLDTQAASLRQTRADLSTALAALPQVEVFPSAANFLLVRLRGARLNADQVFSKLLEQRILIKNVDKMHALLENCIRVTIGTPEENALFLNALKAAL